MAEKGGGTGSWDAVIEYSPRPQTHEGEREGRSLDKMKRAEEQRMRLIKKTAERGKKHVVRNEERESGKL